MYSRNSLIVTLYIILIGFTACSKQFVGVHFNLYAGNGIKDSDAKYLIQCLRIVMSTMDFVAVKFDSTTRVCTPLYGRWLDYAVIHPSEGVFTKTSVDVRYNPPRLIQQGDDLMYWEYVPGEMLPGSSLNLVMSTTQTDAQVSISFGVENANQYMVTLLHYDVSKIGVGCKYNGTYCDIQHASTVTMLPNVEQKFTFIVVNDDVKVYLDGNLAIYYQDAANPMTAAQTKFLAIWVNAGTTYSLHNLSYQFMNLGNVE